MKIFFSVLSALGLVIAIVMTFSGPAEEPKWVLKSVEITEVPEGEYEVPEASEKTITEKSFDTDGKEITTHKGYSKSGELIEIVAYRDGYKHGQQLGMHNGELRKSHWFFDDKAGNYIAIIYDSNGEVVSALCTPNFYTEEQERVCGFKGPFTYSSNTVLGKLEVTMDKGVRSILRQYYGTGELWIEEKSIGGKVSRNEYHQNGKLKVKKVPEKTSMNVP